MAALTLGTQLGRHGFGRRFAVIQEVTLDNSYPTAGYTFDQTLAGQLPNGTVDAVIPAGIDQSVVTATVRLQWNRSTSKVQAFWSAGSAAAEAEVTSTTDLSAYTFILVVIGR